VAISAADLQAIYDQYATKAAGFRKDSETTRGVHRVYRPSQGMKLWEEMTPSEKKQEISDYIRMDFAAAQEEVSGKNSAGYLLDRALDPLDPMSEVYKVVLKKMGATIEEKSIKLPEILQKSLEANNSPTSTNTTPRSPGALRNGHTDDRGNYHITADDRIGKGGKVAKFEDNLAAILLLKTLESEKRNANPQEQSILVRYTGWGGLSEVFKQNLEGTWLDRQNRLKTALSDEEYRSASRSTINAHYTSPEVVRAVWDGACRLGYSGGPTMEPALGIGHFFGMRPSHLPVEMHGIELDSISGRIAQHLYQSADIKINGYENLRMEKDRYNLFISNVPFADVKPYEEKKNQTPGIDNRYSLHDFYFLKSLHGTRSGGLVAFITSRYTLDKENSEVRSKIAESADFIGAIRLPNNTFREIADTEVVTDIVFLQKRPENQPMSDLTKSFINTAELTLQPTDGSAPVSTSINNYFVDHPEMVLGKNELAGTMYRANEYTVSLSDQDLEPLLSKAIQNLPENIMSVMVDNRTLEIESASSPLSHVDQEKLVSGAFVIGQDDRLYQKTPETGKIELSRLYNKEGSNKDDINRIMQMVTIKDCLKDAIDHYYNNQNLEVHRELSRLNSLYDNFIQNNGFFNSRKNASLISSDPEASLLCSLENWDPKTKTATKADIFQGISFVRKPHVTSVETAADAMVLSLSRYGNLNFQFMESVSNLDRDNLVSRLTSSGYLFQDPHEFLVNKRTAYLTSDEYLSGNIREKLLEAKAASEVDPVAFSRHVSSLQEIMPKDLAAEDISVRMNSPIIGEKHVEDFISELLDTQNVGVQHLSINGKWEISGRCWTAQNRDTYGTPDMDAVKIINHIMNGKPVKVYDKAEDDKLYLNTEKTNLAEMKAEAINNAFHAWVWRDADRTNDIVKRYNQVYNSHVERKFIYPERLINPDTKIFFHGCNFPYPMRPHQADAVWRNIQENNIMLSHSVGAGKTLEMACSAMEQRRLGLRAKPMIVCPDHMIGQWASEFRSAYPNAKLLVADDDNWDKDNRRTFINKIATGDWDTVLIRNESFKMIPMSIEYQTEFFENKIAEYKTILDNTDSSNKKSRSVKELEKAVEKYENKIKELSDMHKDEGVLPFDKLGVDQIFIDEADLFKNLEYYTQLQNVRGLGTPTGSERALDMLMKVRHIQENDGGVTFATGTPISNTLVEAYTMQRFLRSRQTALRPLTNGPASTRKPSRRWSLTIPEQVILP
jgi:N12 class adenine-specific DNA methylase